MTTTANWIVTDVIGPPSHPPLKTKYDDAQRTGATVHIFLAAPPPVGGGLQRHPGVETLVVGGRAWQADGAGPVVEGAWDEARRRLRLASGRERDLFGRTQQT
jgi:hypothetical protein